MERNAAIICVDDEPMILNSLRIELRDAFGDYYMIEVAESGEDALEIMEELTEEGFEIPVVISDYIMPEMKGDTVLIEIHRMLPNTHTIMLTGQSGLEGVTNAVNKANLYRYLTKPWSPEDLKMTVEQAIVSFYQAQQLEQTNRELVQLNASLEEKVEKRTQELRLSNEHLARASEELSRKNQIIEEKNQNIEASLNYAKRLQMATFPSSQILHSKLPDSFIFYRPRDVVSGDFYWFDSLDEHIVIVAADCTGHGIPGAFISTIGVVLLNKIVTTEKEISPKAILEQMDVFVQQTFRHRQEGNVADGMDMAVCTLNLNTLQLRYAGAKNPLVLVKNGELVVTKGNRNAIGGGYKRPEPFVEHEFTLQKGDQIYVYSDGMQDQFGGDHGRKMMASHFRSMLWQLSALPAKDQEIALAKKLTEWKGKENRQIDDILVIGVKV